MRPIWRSSPGVAAHLLKTLCLLYVVRLGNPIAVTAIPQLDTSFTVQFREEEFGEILSVPGTKLKHLVDVMKLNFETTDGLTVKAVKIGLGYTCHKEKVLFYAASCVFGSPIFYSEFLRWREDLQLHGKDFTVNDVILRMIAKSEKIGNLLTASFNPNRIRGNQVRKLVADGKVSLARGVCYGFYAHVRTKIIAADFLPAHRSMSRRQYQEVINNSMGPFIGKNLYPLLCRDRRMHRWQ